MQFPLIVICGYPSYQASGLDWKDDDYRASNIVKAIKGRPFKGEARFNFGTIRDDPAGRALAFRVVGASAVSKLKANGIDGGCLVPIPSSSHTEFDDQFVSLSIANSINATKSAFTVSPSIAFKSAMVKASSGDGTRSPSVIKSALKYRAGSIQRDVILVDDVATTHGHIKGASRFLAERGHNVIAAVCVAQTVWERPVSMFKIPPLQIDDSPDTLF